MIQKILKAAGVPSEAEFYKRYPTEAAFFEAHPHLQAGGSSQPYPQPYPDPWQVARTQGVPQLPNNSFANTINIKPGPSQAMPSIKQPLQQGSVNPTYDLSKGFQAANSIMDLVGGIATQFDNAHTARQERQKMYELMQPVSYSNPTQYGAGNGIPGMSGQAGGYFDAGANGNDPNVVAEQNEMFEKNGQVFHIAPGMPGAQRHEDGGTPVNADRVLEATSTMQGRNKTTDKLLQVRPDTAETLTGFRPDKTLSHASAMKKADEYWTAQRSRFTKKAEKILKDPNADKFALASARLNMMQAEQMPSTQHLFDSLFDHQEAIKQFHGIGDEANYAAGIGPGIGAQAGGSINNDTKSDWNNFVSFLKAKNLSGSASLDNGDNPTSGLLDMYHKADPRSELTPQMIPQIQQDFIDHRQAYDRSDLPMSRRDGWVGSITSSYQYPQGRQQTPQPGAAPAGRRGIHYEKLYDASGNMTEYSPVFEGDWTRNDVQHSWKDIPGNFNGIPVARGQGWEALWNNYKPGTTAGQWTKTGQQPMALEVPASTSVPPAQVKPHPSKIKVSYDDNTAAAMQTGGQPNRKEFQMPFQWMQDVPLWDMLNLSKAPVPYIEPQVHDVQLQGYDPTSALNKINSDYRSAVNGLPSSGVGMAAQAQLFASKAKATSEEMDRTSQYNTGISNQNALYHQQYQNQTEQNRAAALQNFNEHINKRNAVFDTQKQADRDQWMHNQMNGWATDFAINKLLPQMYPYYNYDGTSTGKKWSLSTPGMNGNNPMVDSKGSGYEIIQKPELVKKKKARG